MRRFCRCNMPRSTPKPTVSACSVHAVRFASSAGCPVCRSERRQAWSWSALAVLLGVVGLVGWSRLRIETPDATTDTLQRQPRSANSATTHAALRHLRARSVEPPPLAVQDVALAEDRPLDESQGQSLPPSTTTSRPPDPPRAPEVADPEKPDDPLDFELRH